MSYISLANLTRFYSRLKTVLDGKLDASGLVKNDTTEVEGYVPDATVVTAHGREIDALTVRVRTLETNFPDGCSTIAAAVTGGRDGNGTGGVTTASTASPSTIATNIRSMAQLNYDQGVTATKVGTAGKAQVLTGYTFTNSSTVGASGTMATKAGAATSATASWDSTNTRVVMTIPTTAYYNTSSTLYSAASNFGDAAVANVLTGKTFTSTAGLKVQGTMTSKASAATSATASWDSTNTRVVMTIPTTGYYTTASTLYSAASNFGNAAVGNVLAGKTFTSTAGLKATGTMVDKSAAAQAATAAWDSTNTRVKMTIPATGYYTTSSTLYSAGSNFGNAALANVLTGKTFTSSAGLKVTGTMPNNGTVSVATTAGTGDQTISITAGYTTAVKVNRTAAYNAGWSASRSDLDVTEPSKLSSGTAGHRDNTLKTASYTATGNCTVLAVAVAGSMYDITTTADVVNNTSISSTGTKVFSYTVRAYNQVTYESDQGGFYAKIAIYTLTAGKSVTVNARNSVGYGFVHAGVYKIK